MVARATQAALMIQKWRVESLPSSVPLVLDNGPTTATRDKPSPCPPERFNFNGLFDGCGRQSDKDKDDKMNRMSPSIRQTAFDCPHCGAFAQQSWYSVDANRNNIRENLPADYNQDVIGIIANLDSKTRTNVSNGIPVVFPVGRKIMVSYMLCHIFVSSCINCNKISIWIGRKLVYPQKHDAPPANPDLPDGIREDYDEASSILNLSPRGAAALLRLAIQKLCKELGETGKNINNDIGALVSKGLSQDIQRALDTVRVIGNNAVHPGQIDLRDDRATAHSLFAFVNLIADKMISEPKRIKEAYKGLPESTREEIKRRDA